MNLFAQLCEGARHPVEELKALRRGERRVAPRTRHGHDRNEFDGALLMNPHGVKS